jgi:Cu2+-exporting ATPase
LATLIDVMLLGHWLEMRSVREASGALNELAKLLPDMAERLTGSDAVETVRVGDLRVGDLVLVRPGASVPADGRVVEGESEVNESMITGESKPVSKAAGGKVIAGTIIGSGSLRVSVTAIGDQTALAGIMRLVRQAQESKSAAQLLADRAAGWLFYIALGAAAITAAAWTLAAGFSSDVIARAATVLVIACPHALGLAVPLVVAITTSLGASHGILVRDRLALETARKVGVVIFDKTGTLTRGTFGVAGVATADGWREVDALTSAAAVEADSEHPIARAIYGAAVERGLGVPHAEEFKALKGRGVRGRVGGETIYAGGPALLEMLGVQPPPELAEFAEQAGAKGQTAVYVVRQQRVSAVLAISDVLRPDSRTAVRELQAMGVEVAILTGDAERIAKSVAGDLGVNEYAAGVLPENKDQKVLEFKRGGRTVAMVGDGVNDAPALARADVGIAIGGGTDVAIESAGIILVKSDPRDVARVIRLSRASYRKMVQNLIWAAGYNVVALPLAAGVLAPWGIVLSPAVGAALMSLSTVIVAANAQLLRGARLDA